MGTTYFDLSFLSQGSLSLVQYTHSANIRLDMHFCAGRPAGRPRSTKRLQAMHYLRCTAWLLCFARRQCNNAFNSRQYVLTHILSTAIDPHITMAVRADKASSTDRARCRPPAIDVRVARVYYACNVIFLMRRTSSVISRTLAPGYGFLAS